jgi:hypothetical protein
MSTRSRNAAQMRSRVATSPRARWGWGPSDLASEEEEEAWQALQMQRAIGRGEATVADLPEAYGGRPTGSTRRAIRQQVLWDAQQAARLAEEENMRKEEEFNRKSLIANYDFVTKTADRQRAQEEALLQKQEEARRAESELRLSEYANSLDPYDTTSASKIAAFISKDAALINNPKATGTYDFFKKSSSKSETVIKMEEEATIQQSLREARQAGVSPEQIAAAKTLDKDGNETYDLGKLRYATDITVGSRVAEAETRKQPTDTRTPLEKAEDDLAEKRARLGAFVDEEGVPPEYDEMTESYRRALADVKQSEARVKRLGGESEPEEPEEEEEYPDERIEKARAIAQNPSHPRNKDAIRFLKSIGQSY